MATTKNIIMKQFNGTDYDTLYPKTIASQIPDVYSKSETYPQSQLYTQSQIDSMINSINNAINGKAKIQTGSYVGTGTYGENNPCSLTFDFEPKFIFCSYSRYPSNGDVSQYKPSPKYYDYCYTISWTTTPQHYYGFGINGYGPDSAQQLYGYTSTDRKTYYWYNQADAESQNNDSGKVYYWLCIG